VGLEAGAPGEIARDRLSGSMGMQNFCCLQVMVCVWWLRMYESIYISGENDRSKDNDGNSRKVTGSLLQLFYYSLPPVNGIPHRSIDLRTPFIVTPT
jgi:hypothetical protein